MDIKLDSARQRVEELHREIEGHNYRYFVLDDPLISDAQYDKIGRASCRERV